MTATTFLGLPWFVWGALCLLVAAIYLVVWPRPRGATSARPLWRRVVLRWFHALVWALLAASCFVQAVQAPRAASIGSVLALTALLVYIVFMVTLTAERVKRKT